MLDFNDLLIHARNLLVGRRARTACASGWPRKSACCWSMSFRTPIQLQVELVKALCDNEYLRGKLFFVGDHKQSIYRFRGAEPERVPASCATRFPTEGRLPLSLNFRSQPAILDFVNALFAEELGPDYEPLRASRAAARPHAGGGVSLGRRRRKADGGEAGEGESGDQQPRSPSP